MRACRSANGSHCPNAVRVLLCKRVAHLALSQQVLLAIIPDTKREYFEV